MKSKNVLYVTFLILNISTFSFSNSFGQKNNDIRYELPKYKNTNSENYIDREYYTIFYSKKLSLAKWVAFQLSKGEIQKIEIKNKKKDFKSEKFQKGHLVPNRYLNEKINVSDNEYDILNIVPQTEKLNNGVWRVLENRCNSWSKNEKIGKDSIKKIYITAGCITNKSSERLNNKITIPDSLFKVILFELQNGGFKSIGFVFPNDTTFNCLCFYAKPVQEVEKSTSLVFFTALDTNQYPDLKSDTSLVGLINCDSKKCPNKKKKTKR